MRARVGKIAKLPEFIREQLNYYLSNGVFGKDTIPWLNSLPEVRQILAEHFGGRPISEHNVSEWRHGGYQDWLREKENRARILQLTDKYQNVESEARLDRRVERLMVAQLVDAIDQLHQVEDDNIRFRRLQRICREMARMQNLHCRGLEVQLQQEKARQYEIQTQIRTGIQKNSNSLEPSRTYSHKKHIGGEGVG